MAFKVRASRNDDGSYGLSYGKGGNKLETILRNGADGWWIDSTVGSFDPSYKTKREAIESFGEWALANYAGSRGKPQAPIVAEGKGENAGEPTRNRQPVSPQAKALSSPDSLDLWLDDIDWALDQRRDLEDGRFAWIDFYLSRLRALRKPTWKGSNVVPNRLACPSGTCGPSPARSAPASSKATSGPPKFTPGKAKSAHNRAGEDVPQSAVSGGAEPDVSSGDAPESGSGEVDAA